MANQKVFTPPRKKVFRRLFLSNLIMLLLPLLAGWGMYSQLEKIIYQNAYHSNRLVISQLRQNVDHRIKELQQFSYLISVNTKVQSLLSEMKSDHPQTEYLTTQLLIELRKYSQINSMIDDFAIRVDRTDSIVAPIGKMDSLFYFTHYLSYKDMSYEEWIRNYVDAGYSYQRFLPVTENLNGKAVLTFTSSLPLGERTAILGKLLIMLDQSKLLDSAEFSEKSNPAQLFIINNDNDIVMSTSDQLTNDNQLLSAITGSVAGSLKHTLGTERMMITYEQSQQTDWKYVIAVPEASFIAPVLRVKYAAILSGGACLLIGLIAAYVMTKRNYSPLRKLISSIELKSHPESSHARWDEWDALKYSMEESSEEERQLRGQLHKHFPVIQSSYIHRLIRGHVESDTIMESSTEMLGAPFPFDSYAVLLIDLEDCSDIIKDDSERQWAHVRFIIMNILQDILHHQGMKVFFAEMERDQIGGLINHWEEKATWKQTMHECLLSLKNVLENRLGIFVTAAVSDSQRGAAQIGACYTQALRTMEFKWLKGQNSFIFYSDLGDVEKTYFYPVETESQIINLVKQADYEQVSKRLDEVYSINFDSGAIAPELGKWLMYNIVSSLLKCLQVMNLKYSDVFIEEEAPHTRLAACATLFEMFHEIKKMYATLCNYVQAERSDHNHELLNKMYDYLNSHVYDPMLGLESTAEHMGLTPKYVSSFFKLQTKQTLTDYIAKMRVEEAKKLLLETNLTILEISQKLGYTSDIGLQRIFKKHTGVTPGKYRTGMKQ